MKKILSVRVYTCLLAFLCSIISFELAAGAGLVLVIIFLVLLSLTRKSSVYFVLAGISLAIVTLHIHQQSYSNFLQVGSNSRSYELEVVRIPEQKSFNQKVIATCFSCYGLIELTMPKYPSVGLGDTLVVSGTLKPTNTDESYLLSKGIFTSFGEVHISSSHKFGLLKIINTLRQRMITGIRDRSLHPSSELVIGLVLGDDTAVPADSVDAMKRLGIIHLLAVSGGNVALLLGAVFKLFNLIFRRNRALVFSGTIVGLFIFLVGLDNTPALRAGLLALLWIVSQLFGYKVSYNFLIALTLAILLAINPFSVFDIGLQLSFGATLGILNLAKPLQIKINHLTGKFLGELISVSIAATIATAPIIWINWGEFAVFSVLANIIFVPLIGAISLFLYAAIPLFTLFPVASLLEQSTWLPVQLMLDLMMSLINILGSPDWLVTKSSFISITIYGIYLLFCIDAYKSKSTDRK